MAADDWYSFVAREQWQKNNAEIAQYKANLEAAKATNDSYAATAAAQDLANARANQRNLEDLHGEYVRSQQPPPPPPEPTPEERHARPWDKMTWQDGLDLARTSKYGADIDANDPNVQAGFREVIARRQRGE